jgi:hypothetical protein
MKPALPFLLAGAVLLAGCASLDPNRIVARYNGPPVTGGAVSTRYAGSFAVAAGQSSIVGDWLSLNPDCSLVGYPTVSLVTPPGHGTVSIMRGSFFPHYPARNARVACNTQPHPGVEAVYRPAPGAAGPDNFTIAIIFPYGRSVTTDFHVTIQSPGGGPT